MGNASWEFRNTILASSLGVAPKLFDAWYNRHSASKQRSGLRMVMGIFSCDMHTLLLDSPMKVIPMVDALCRQAVAHMRAMANNDMLCYDLKPSNLVFAMDGEVPQLRFIDFGRDFCEWKPFVASGKAIARAPVLTFIEKLAIEHADDRITARTLYRELIFATMVIILSSNISFTLSQSERAARCSYADRGMLNFMSKAAADTRQYTRSSHGV